MSNENIILNPINIPDIAKKEIPIGLWTIYDLATKCTPYGWVDVFKKSDNELKKVSQLIEKDETDKKYISVPSRENIFATFVNVPLNKVRVIIIGQDVYHGPGQAIGRSFAVPKGMPIPPSLKNIYKEISSCIPNFKTPNHGDLSKWEKNGVLLLNASLTTIPNIANAHGKYKIWTGFIKNVLEAIGEKNPYCIYLLWGDFAKSLEKYIGEKSIKLISAHPSPLSANKGGWFGNQHFLKVNQELKKLGQEEIDWNLD